MMRRLGLLAERQAEEATLIASSPDAKPILERLAEIYNIFRAKAPQSQAMQALQGIYHGSVLMFVGHTLSELQHLSHPFKECWFSVLTTRLRS